MTEGDDFMKKGTCKNKHCLSMSSSVWCDLNSKGDILKLHDKCSNPNCNCQTLITFTPRQYMLEGGSIKVSLNKSIKVLKKLGTLFLNQQ